MYYVYIIESVKTGRWYVGSTGDLEKRLKYHNNGKVRSTKPYRPYKMIYTEKFNDKTLALKREHQIKKSGIIRKELKASITAPSSIG